MGSNQMKVPMHIIIDGTDKIGKSTVCRILSQGLQIPLVKMPNMKDYLIKNQPEEFSRLFNETIVQFKDSDFILDRGFTSSVVYSIVFNRDFDLSYIKGIESALKPKVFILVGKPRAMDDVFMTQEQILIDKGFRHLAEARNYNLIEVDGLSPEEVTNEIIKRL